MSNDIARAATAHLGQAFENYDIEQDADYITNPNAGFATVKMSTDGFFVISIGDQNLPPVEDLYFVVVSIFGSRALFTEEGDKPVCSTPFLPPTKSAKKDWEGVWRNEDISPGFDISQVEDYPNILCRRCPWARFGSDERWCDENGGSGGRGPACKEKRFLYGYVVKQTSEHQGIPLYERVNDTIHRLILPATSIKTVEGMVVKAKSGGVPLPAAAFRLQANVMSSGSMKWSVLKADIKGFIGQETWPHVLEARQFITDAIASFGQADEEPYGSTQTEPSDDEPVGEPAYPGDDGTGF